MVTEDKEKFEYRVMDGGDIGAIAQKIMEHEKKGWDFVVVLTQPMAPPPQAIINAGKPQGMVIAHFPLMRRIVKNDN